MSEEAAAETVRQLDASFTECIRNIPRCDPVSISGAHASGPLRDAIYLQVKSLKQEGRTAENVDSRTITVEGVVLDPGAGKATVTVCENDGTVQRDSGGNVVNDVYVSRRMSYDLTAGTEWLAVGRTELERVTGEGNGLCAAG